MQDQPAPADELQTLRYRRQTAVARVGQNGQRRIAAASVLLVGVGALGTTIAERLVRSGIGHLRLVDRDWVEWDNLPRQALFDERDAAERAPKAAAAATHLARINRDVRLEPIVADFTAASGMELANGCNLILDGTDNFETRYLINDISLERNIPWVHGGVIGAAGQLMAVVPGQTCCLRCLLPDPPLPGSMPTCQSAGVLGSSVGVIASWQATEAIKLLVEGLQDIPSRMMTIDTWSGVVRLVHAPLSLRLHCPACGEGRRDFLHGDAGARPAVLCGRNAVQVHMPLTDRADLEGIAGRLGELVQNANPYFIRLTADGFGITLFADGRAVVEGTEDPAVARTILSRLVGL